MIVAGLDVRCNAWPMTGLNLPKKCGVMLLPDCTLFPHGGLPLYIFEERYREMLKQALEGDCVFAVGHSIDPEVEGSISPIGTAGLVRASREREDGTSELLLHGVIRVKFTEWLDDEPFPCALIEPLNCDPLEEKSNQAAMKTMMGAVEDCLSELPKEVQDGVITLVKQADEAGFMADLISQQIIHNPDHRQQLLETIAVGERVALLCEFLGQIRLES